MLTYFDYFSLTKKNLIPKRKKGMHAYPETGNILQI